jgi:hypothetical protein
VPGVSEIGRVAVEARVGGRAFAPDDLEHKGIEHGGVVAETSYFERDGRNRFGVRTIRACGKSKTNTTLTCCSSCTMESAPRTGAPTRLRSSLPSSVSQRWRVVLSVGYRRRPSATLARLRRFDLAFDNFRRASD